MSDIKIAWGLQRVDGRPRYIMTVPTGLACDCVCAACKTPLEAVNSENPDPKRRPHFRHYALPPTGECGLRAVVIAAGAILERTRNITLPMFSVKTHLVDDRGQTVYGHAHVYDGDAAVSFGDLYFDNTVVLLRLNGGRELFLLLTPKALLHIAELPLSAAVMLVDVASVPNLALASYELGLRLLDDLIAKGRWIRHWDEDVLKGKAEQDGLRQIESMRQTEVLRMQRASERLATERKAAIQRQAETSQSNSAAPRLSEVSKAVAPPEQSAQQPPAPFEPSSYSWEWSQNPRWSREKAVGLYAGAWPGPDWSAVANEAIRMRDMGADPTQAILHLGKAFMEERPSIVQNFLAAWGIVAKRL